SEMAHHVSVLEITKTEKLPNSTSIMQVEDGTIFYRKFGSPNKLYVKRHHSENEICADLPGEEIDNTGTHGNAVYFASNGKIYKAIFTAPDKISVHYLRNEQPDETFRKELCSRIRDGRTYVYRMCDDPDRDGILIDDSDDELIGLFLRHVHRGRAILFSENSELVRPSVREVGDTAIMVSNAPKSYAPADSSPFLYFSDGESLYTLDTETMKFLPDLRFDGMYRINSIAGVHNGVITMEGERGMNNYLIASSLPQGYFGVPVEAEKSQQRVRELETIIEQQDEKLWAVISELEKNEAFLETVRERNSDLEKRYQQNKDTLAVVNNTNCSLVKKNAELVLEKAQLNKAQKEEIAELRTSNAEYIMKSNDLIREKDQFQILNQKMKDELNHIVEELTKRNGKLSEDINRSEEVKSELEATIRVLRAEIDQEKDRATNLKECMKFEINDTIHALRDQNGKISREKNQFKTLYEGKEAEIVELQKQIANIQALELDQIRLTEEANALRDENSKQLRMIIRTEQENDKLKNAYVLLKSKMTAESEDNVLITKELTDVIQTLSEQTNELTEQNVVLRNLYTEQEHEIDWLQQKISDQGKELIKIEKTNKEHNDKLNDKINSLRRKTIELDHVKSVIQSLEEEENSKLQHTIAHLETQIAEHTHAKHQTKETIDALDNTITDLRNQISCLQQLLEEMVDDDDNAPVEDGTIRDLRELIARLNSSGVHSAPNSQQEQKDQAHSDPRALDVTAKFSRETPILRSKQQGSEIIGSCSMVERKEPVLSHSTAAHNSPPHPSPPSSSSSHLDRPLFPFRAQALIGGGGSSTSQSVHQLSPVIAPPPSIPATPPPLPPTPPPATASEEASGSSQSNSSGHMLSEIRAQRPLRPVSTPSTPAPASSAMPDRPRSAVAASSTTSPTPLNGSFHTRLIAELQEKQRQLNVFTLAFDEIDAGSTSESSQSVDDPVMMRQRQAGNNDADGHRYSADFTRLKDRTNFGHDNEE
ncbi:hypothetical protein PENTCL1PPCAC_8719, partial [Pristionchus entomophagus]